MEDRELSLAVALARRLLHDAGALRVSIALDREPPAVVECARLRSIVVREAGGERELPHDVELGIEPPALPPLRRLPPFEADAARGTVAGVPGGLELLGDAVRAIASMLPGRSVVAAEFETTDPGAPLGIAGRSGEPPIVLLDEHEFEL